MNSSYQMHQCTRKSPCGLATRMGVARVRCSTKAIGSRSRPNLATVVHKQGLTGHNNNNNSISYSINSTSSTIVAASRSNTSSVQRSKRSREGARVCAQGPTQHAGVPTEQDHISVLEQELKQDDIVAIAQIAPAVRVAIGEEFGMEPGSVMTGKIITALKRLGFKYVFDVTAGADLTIMEEGTELVERLKGFVAGKKDAAPLPMFTSCCPGWIDFVGKCSPEMLPYISTCKSPQIMEGAVLKAFFTDVSGHPKDKLRVVSVMPCVRKQGEADKLSYQTDEGYREVDHVVTTKGLAEWLKKKGIDLAKLEDSHFDKFMGYGTGASVLFGTSGGTMEAALRTVYDILTSGDGDSMGHLEYEAVRGMDGIKEASVTIPPNPEGPLGNSESFELRVAVANGLGNAKKLLQAAKEEGLKYHFIEVMACPGGCMGGAGQPRAKLKETLLARQRALYSIDKGEKIRKSYKNPVIKDLYTKYLGKPGSRLAEHLLHTSFDEKGEPRFNMFDADSPHPSSSDGQECDI